MKHILIWTLVLSIFNTSYLFGNEYLDQAKTSVEVAKERAKLDGMAHANEDYQAALQRIVQGFTQYSAEQTKFNESIEGISSLELKIEKMIQSGLEENLFNEVSLKKIVEEYREISLESFRVAWSQDDLMSSLEAAEQLTSKVAQEYAAMCEVGRSRFSADYSVPSYPEPPYKETFGYRVNWQWANLLFKGSPASLDMYYSNANSGSQQANINRNVAAGIAGAYANASTNAYIISTFMPSLASSSAVFTHLVAVAPMALVVAAVVMVIVSFLAKREAYKLSEKVARANEYIVNNSPNFDHVFEAYKENCGSQLEMIKALTIAVNNIVSVARSGQKPKVTKSDMDLVESFENDSKEMTENENLILLNNGIKDKGCLDLEGLSEEEATAKLKANEEKKEFFCFKNISGELYQSMNSYYYLPVLEDERSKVVSEAQKKIDSYINTYTPKTVSEIMQTKVKTVMRRHGHLQDRFKGIDFNKISELKDKAFNQLLKTIGLYNESIRSSGNTPLFFEIKIEDEFHGHFRSVSQLAVDAIHASYYGGSYTSKFKKRIKIVESEITDFIHTYGHHDEVLKLRLIFLELKRIGEEI